MSNAAVIKLQKKVIAGYSVWLDDNFGEAIHLHMNDFRVDLTCSGFEQITRDAQEILDLLIQVEGFHSEEYDPVFLEQMLWKRLLHLERVEKDEVRISELWMNEPRLCRVKDSRMYRSLMGERKKLRKKGSDHLGQSAEERMESIRKSIDRSGYDVSRGSVVVYGDDNIIRDGQHRVCALMMKEGDVTVPVIHLYFSDMRTINTKLRSSPIGFFYHCFWKLGEQFSDCKKRKFISKNTLKALLKSGYTVTKKRKPHLHRLRMSKKKELMLREILDR